MMATKSRQESSSACHALLGEEHGHRERSAADRQGRSPEPSGVLLHPTSLPGAAWQRATAAPAAHHFVDWLARAGQVAVADAAAEPIGPGNSPYSAVGLCRQPAADRPARQLRSRLAEQRRSGRSPSSPGPGRFRAGAALSHRPAATGRRALLRVGRTTSRAAHGLQAFCQRGARLA
jgi:hypothetical protein